MSSSSKVKTFRLQIIQPITGLGIFILFLKPLIVPHYNMKQMKNVGRAKAKAKDISLEYCKYDFYAIASVLKMILRTRSLLCKAIIVSYLVRTTCTIVY